VTTRRALVVEDEAKIHRGLAQRLGEIFPAVDIAEDIEKAWSYLNSHDYELVTIDLSLVAGVKPTKVVPNEKGFELLGRIRRSPRDAPNAIVMITGYPTTERVRNAFAEYHIDDFIEKSSEMFAGDTFVSRIRRVLVNGRVRTAERRLTERHRATIVASSTQLISSEISGPQQEALTLIEPRARLEVAAFGRRADAIEQLVRFGGGQWRQPAKQVGDLSRYLHREAAVDAQSAVGP
jgi:DNA-binding response OmpR family regulator